MMLGSHTDVPEHQLLETGFILSLKVALIYKSGYALM